MESQTYKYTGAFLAAAFVMMSASLLSDVIFDSPDPEKEGYHIEPLASTTAAPEKAAPVVSIATLLQTADPAKGADVFKRCQACHSGEKDGPNKVGPHLWGIVDRPIASIPDFSYSAGMKDFAATAKTWTYDHLNGFLTSPRNYVKGTAMGFAGDKNDAERANLIAYLRTLADTPAPLPAAPAAGATPADGAKPAEGEAAKPAENTAPAPAAQPAPAAPAEPAPAAPAPQPAPAPAPKH